MFAGGQTGPAAPRVRPRPGDLKLPRDVEITTVAPYTVPAEFWDARQRSIVNIDTEPNFVPWQRGDGFLGSVGSSAKRAFKMLMSLGGLSNTSRNVLAATQHPWDYGTGQYERNILESRDPRAYAFMDEDYARAQEMASYGTIGLSLFVLAYAGSKNLDGAGRLPMIWDRNETGIYKVGALPAAIGTKLPIYLSGGVLAAQHRFLQGRDGMSSTEAYFTALNPLEGWPLTLHDRDHNFRDFIYADFVASAVFEFIGQYFYRLGNIGSVSAYGVLSTFDARDFKILNKILPSRVLQAFNAIFSDDRFRSHLEEFIHAKAAELEATRAQYLKINGKLQEWSREARKIQRQVSNANGANKKAVNLLRGNRERMRAAQEELRKLDGKISALEKWEAALQKRLGREVPLAGRSLTKTEVRQIVFGALAEGRKLWAPGQAYYLDTLEGARNLRQKFSAAEIAAGSSKSKVGRFFYGAGRTFANGRLKIIVPRYAINGVVGWAEGTLVYHYMWDMPWGQAAESAASIFLTTIPNQGWVGGLKATGVRRVPGVVEYIPSAAMVNLWWSVTRWDKTIMLQRCKSKASDLVHSLDPEYRARIRADIAELWRMANEQEKKFWSLPRSEGGCGMPPPSK